MAELWPFPPDKMSVEVSWVTSVLSSYTTEQRASLRQLSPRGVISLSSLGEAGLALHARTLARNSANEWRVPDWRFSQRVNATFSDASKTFATDTDTLYLQVGDKALAYVNASTYHEFTIAAIGGGSITGVTGPATAYTSFLIIPVLTCVSGAPVDVNEAPTMSRVSSTFTCLDYPDLSSYAPSYPSYGGYPVNTSRDVTTNSPGSKVLRFVTMVDGGVGKIDIEPVFDHWDMGGMISVEATGSAAMLEAEGWLHTLNGKRDAFFKPTWQKDFVLTADASAGASSILVVAGPTAAYLVGTRICAARLNGTFEFNKITAASTSVGVTTLTLETPLGSDLTQATTISISEMNLMRLDTDRIELKISPGVFMRYSAATAGLDNDL